MRAFLACAPLLAGCGGAGGEPSAKPPHLGSWVTSHDVVDRRKLTVLVRVTTPPNLVTTFTKRIVPSKKEDAVKLGMAASGYGLGSGFVLIGDGPGGARETFVVTNAHVVEWNHWVVVETSEGAKIHNCEVVYTDVARDLAVIVFPPNEPPHFDAGFALGDAPVKELQTVVASGFPSLARLPSYQATRGEVSNVSVELPARYGRRTVLEPQNFIQHTAPIDPGSSGGPLTDDAGRVIGVNTAIARGRNSVSLAVPAADVYEAVKRAALIVKRRAETDWLLGLLRKQCRALIDAAAARRPRGDVVVGAISNELIAAQARSTIEELESSDKTYQELLENPAMTMREAIYDRLRNEVAKAGGAAGACEGPIGTSPTASGVVHWPLTLGDGAHDVAWEFVQGRWELADFEFRQSLDPVTPPDPPAPAPSAKPPGGGRGKASAGAGATK